MKPAAGPGRSSTHGRDKDSHRRVVANSALKPWQVYVFAIVATAITTWLRLTIGESLNDRPTLVMFIVPILISAYLGGLRPGLVATGLTAVFASYYLVIPLHSFVVASGEDRWDLFLVSLAGVVISVLMEVIHRAQHRTGIAIREHQHAAATLLTAAPLQTAIFNSANFSCIATDAKGVIQIFNVGAERMLGYTAAELVDKITPADLSDPKELIARATDLSIEFTTPIAPGFDALIFKASRGIEDIYELTYIRKDASRFLAMVSVTALRDAQNAIIGYLLIGTDNSARKQAEADRNRFFAVSRDLLCTLGFDGVFRELNPAWQKTLGFTPEELRARPFIEFVHPDDRDVTLVEAAKIEAGNDLIAFENRYCCKDGSYRWLLWSVTPDMANGVMFASARDVTERKVAEEALIQADGLRSAIFNSAAFSSIATDAKGVIQIFNVGAERMLGYTAGEVVNKITPVPLHDPQEVIARATALSLEFATPIAPGFEALVFKASRGLEDIYELTKVRKDGTRFPALLSVTALRDAHDGIIGYLLIGTDNTARKRAEDERTKLDQRLRDQHFYTRSLIESNIDALMTTDPRGIITDVNKQMEALTDCTRDELIGAPFKNYFTDPERAQAGIDCVLTEKKLTEYELTACARNGAKTDVSYNATTFYDRDRQLQGVFASARDVTERKRFEQALQQKNVELESASRMKSEFLANMSHELRTPLNAIIGFSEVLRDGLLGEMTVKQRGFIGDIFGSGTHLLSLINDILDLSKVEAGKMLLEVESVLVSSLLANSLSIVREKAASRQIHLQLNAEEIGSVHVDVRKVKQIVYNLLSNAVKFTNHGGEVTLRAAIVTRSAVGQSSDRRTTRILPLADSGFADFLEVCVTDSGIGISPEGMDQLFKPFSQIDSGLARRFEGTGLGLAMVKLLTELHGGTVAVESAEGEGSSFTVWLPLRGPDDCAEFAPGEPFVRDEPEAGVPLALVVEGDFKSAGLIRVQLEAEGFAVLHAASAEAGLMLAVQQPLALITLDIMLPNMDGWEFLARIKKVPGLRRVPVVIISIAANRTRGFALGAAAVMQKPISRQELSEALSDLGVFPLSPGQTLRVLVVDDDPKAVELSATRVEALAGTVLRASSGGEAIELARRDLPDVIILDLMMPGINGFDVVDALQERPDTARIPILVVTAKDITADDRARLNGYVTAIVEKTEFDSDCLTREVRRAMAGRNVVA
jgi:PAS domain S-box-containing protein